MSESNFCSNEVILYNKSGCTYFNLGEIELAEQAFRQALDIEPTDANAIINLLYLQVFMKDQNSVFNKKNPLLYSSKKLDHNHSALNRDTLTLKDNLNGTQHSKNFTQLIPLTFTVETILGCNFQCPECAVGGDFIVRKKGWMNFERFKIIADKIRPYCQYLYLHIWGEPLLNKDIFKMISYASRFTKTHISTNGNLMTEETAARLIRSGVSDIIVSIDGVSQEIYERYRVGGQVEKAINALKNLKKFKNQFGSNVNIHPQYIVFKHNQHEMQKFNELCRTIGFKPIFKAPYIRHQNSQFKLSDYSQFTRPVYQKLSNLRAAMRDCPNAENVFTILLDGSVVLCCHDHGGATCYGNIFDQSVEDIWNSDEFRKERHNILSGKAPKFCLDNCMTWFLDKNQSEDISQQKKCEKDKHTATLNNNLITSNDVTFNSGDDQTRNSLLNGRKLNLCSGSNKIRGFVNIDFLPGADLVIDLEKDLLPFTENSVDVVVCNSAINYFTRNRAQEIITDVYRVLKPGGIARFGTQDLRVLVEKYISNDKEFYFQKLPDGSERFPGTTIGDKLNEFFYGFGVRDKHCKYLYDYESLKVLIQNAGFKSILQKGFKESLIPEIERIDNRPKQMFFLEAVKTSADTNLADLKNLTGLKPIESIMPEQALASLNHNFEKIRATAFKKWENGQLEKAWQLFLQVLELKADDTSTVLQCIEILENHGRYEDILKVCKNYLATKPSDQHIRKIFHNVQYKINMDIPDSKEVAQARADIAQLNVHKNDIHSDEKHLKACLQWLTRAQQAHSGGGVSSIYHLETKAWNVDYPETTGYIIPTFLSYYKYSGIETYLRSAVEMGDWEVDIQAPDGGVGEPLGVYGLQPRVFNTGQVLFGWIALYKQTGDSKYLEAARKAANWIVECQDPDGKWSRNTYMGPKAYHSRVAWSLLELYNLSKEKKLQIAASNAINWILSLGHENGWFGKNSLTTPGKPWTHLIGYVLVGLLESCMLDSHNSNITNLLSLLTNAAKNLADYCIKSAEISGNGQLKTLPGTFDQNWMSNDNWTCVTGNAQIAFFLRKMFALFNDDMLITASDHLIKNLKSIHFVDGISDPNLHGGLPGSYPIGGGYASNAIPNWGVKFFADSLLLRTASFSDQKYLG